MKRNLFFFFPIVLWVTFILIQSALAQPEDFDYSELDIEELMEVKIVMYSSAARKKQTLSETAAAFFVITQNEIRRSGVNSLPEALRLVPGLQVAQIDADQWAISARGLNEQFADKLLVMIDGRTVYTPLRSGVFWEVQDTLMEDVDHIEVVLGPGASLWGANAVNGVINIITKSAQETQGSLVTSSIGKGEERYHIGVRQGNTLTGGGHYRIYGKSYQHDHAVQDKRDSWQTRRGGFRMDWTASKQESFTIQGDIYEGTLNESSFHAKKHLAGLNLLGRWQGSLDKGDFILQTYYDQTRRDEVLYEEWRGTYDIDFQRRWMFPGQQEILGGVAYRYSQDHIDNSSVMSYHPAQKRNNLFSAFLQGDFHISLSHLFSFSQAPTQQDAKKLRLTLGCKWEYYEDEKLQIQPNLRVLWNHDDHHTFWGAISRAVRAPSRTDKDIFLDMNSAQEPYSLQGNPHFKPEILVAYEWGYRFNKPDNILLDANFFVNKYSDLSTIEPVDKLEPVPTQFTFENQKLGTIYGLEIAAQWKANKFWTLRGAYSYLNITLRVNQESKDVQATLAQGESPQHQMSLHSFLNLSHNIFFDTTTYYVDDLPTLSIPHYVRFDVRVGWRPKPNFELNFGVRNLFDKQHPEFNHRGIIPSVLTPTEIPRATYLQLKYQF